jgi:hypothetical protein
MSQYQGDDVEMLIEALRNTANRVMGPARTTVCRAFELLADELERLNDGEV